jgi:hypothetical protein
MSRRNRSGKSQQSPAQRFTTETKQATKTTELIAYVLAVAGVAITAFTVDNNPDFGAEQAWLYITILTVGYMLSRGLAKAGSYEPYDQDDYEDDDYDDGDYEDDDIEDDNDDEDDGPPRATRRQRQKRRRRRR